MARSLTAEGAPGGLVLALPKGRIEGELGPLLRRAGIEPEPGFADPEARALRFATNHPGLSIVRVRSFDVATFVAFDAAQLGALQRATAGVKFADSLVGYLLQIVRETRGHESVEIGVSPRGAIALRRAAQARALVEGRDFCIPEDVRDLGVDVLAHRIQLDARAGRSDGG